MNRIFFAGILFFGAFVAFTAQATPWTQQRWVFKQAYQAFLAGDEVTFEQNFAKLEIASYPIAHYLRYFRLMKDLEKTEAIHTFLKQYPHEPLAETLRQAYLKQLAEQKNWQTFLTIYTPQTEITLQCYYLQAQLEIGQPSETAFAAAKTLWLVGKSQPEACDGLFAHLYAKDLITEEMRWQRVSLALQNGELGLASFLVKPLTQEKQAYVAQWRALQDSPKTVFAQFSPVADVELTRMLLHHGLKRLAREDAKQALEKFEQYKKSYRLTEGEEGAKTFRYLALKAADQQLAGAEKWLNAIDETVVDEGVYQARLQFALLQSHWQAVLSLTEQLITSENLKWRYWRARALEETDQAEKARAIFTPLAQERHYYGFLAAERLQQPYHFGERAVGVSEKSIKQLLAKPAVVRARELYLVGLLEFARAEWQSLLETLSVEELKGAAVLAHRWGWYDRAIVTLTKAQAFDDLTLRFPTPFYDTVLTGTTAQKLDTAWVYAVMRQESAFQPDARSVSNALGLMQLLPSTAKEVAGKLKLSLKNEADILEPELNIRLGTGYLRYLLDRFDHNRLLATAGYNAGPARAKQWAERACLPKDVWIELIPFNETRDYVQRVMSYAPIFEYQWTGNATSIAMPIDEVTDKFCAP